VAGDLEEFALPGRVGLGAGVPERPVSGPLPEGDNERLGDGPFQFTAAIR